MINVGPDTFLVTAEGLRASLELVLKGVPLSLTYASRVKDTPARYIVGFESVNAKGKGIPPVTDPDLQLTGLLLILDAGEKYPVVAINLGVNRDSHAIDQAGLLGFETQRIITAGTPAASTPVAATP